VQYQMMPHNHSKKIAKFYWVTPELVAMGNTTTMAAKADWEKVPIDEKAEIDSVCELIDFFHFNCLLELKYQPISRGPIHFP